MMFRQKVCLFAVSALVLAGEAGGFPRAVQADGLSAGGGAVVVADALNLRGGPSLDNPVVDVLPLGTRLRLLAGPVNDVWWRVTDNALVGYVEGTWLTTALPPEGPETFDLDLAIPFHPQMNAIWCDPADLQSWVEYDLGGSLGESYGVQQDLWDWELGNNAGFTLDEWNASPYAVASAAHRWLPDRGFNHFIYDDPVQATTTTAWLLANPEYGEPAIALIWQADHYVLVRGVRATSDPFLDYPHAQVLGLYLMDPNQASPSWLGEDRYVPIVDWLSAFLTPVTYLTPHSGVPGDPWQDRYVVVQRDWDRDAPTPDGRVNASPASYLPAAEP
ncbi:MAG: SH3 domain-containing protein [Dehalococcoidia bacterium]|nr:SH3 domain-containing protein [Dehalococcoidia bacterium]